MDECSGGLEPLQMILNLEQTTKLLEKVTSDLSSCRYSSIQPSIISLSFNLKRHGPSLELHHGELLKSLQKVLRSACRDTKLDLVSRVHLLEIIEVRSANWAPSHHITEFYKIKLQQIKEISEPTPGIASTGSSALEVSRTSSSRAAPKTTSSDSSTTQTISSKSSSCLNAEAPEFCLFTSHLPESIPDQPTTVLRPDSPAFISHHQPSFNHSPLDTYSGDNLKSYPGNNQFVEKDVNDGEGSFSKKEENSSKNGHIGHSHIALCDKMSKETFHVHSNNSSKYKATVHTEKGDIFMTSFSVDLLRTAKQILEKGLKDKIVNEGSPKLIYQNPAAARTGYVQAVAR